MGDKKASLPRSPRGPWSASLFFNKYYIKMGIGVAYCKFKFLGLECAFLTCTSIILMQIVLKIILATIFIIILW